MNNIRKARKQIGMTAKQLGEAVWVTDAAISQYENEKRQPSFEVLLKMCEVLGCSSPTTKGNPVREHTSPN